MIRPNRWLAAGVLVGASAANGAADGNPLTAERWKTRPLVVVVPVADDPLLTQFETALRSDTARAAFADREMVFYKVVAGRGSRDEQPLSASQTRALLDAVAVASTDPATVLLVGKDGGVKVKERGGVSLEDLFATIDRMPMRQRP